MHGRDAWLQKAPPDCAVAMPTVRWCRLAVAGTAGSSRLLNNLAAENEIAGRQYIELNNHQQFIMGSANVPSLVTTKSGIAMELFAYTATTRHGRSSVSLT